MGIFYDFRRILARKLTDLMRKPVSYSDITVVSVNRDDTYATYVVEVAGVRRTLRTKLTSLTAMCPNALEIETGNQIATVAELVPKLNKKFGFSFSTEDFAEQQLQAGTNWVNLSPGAKCMAFKDHLPITVFNAVTAGFEGRAKYRWMFNGNADSATNNVLSFGTGLTYDTKAGVTVAKPTDPVVMGQPLNYGTVFSVEFMLVVETAGQNSQVLTSTPGAATPSNGDLYVKDGKLAVGGVDNLFLPQLLANRPYHVFLLNDAKYTRLWVDGEFVASWPKFTTTLTHFAGSVWLAFMTYWDRVDSNTEVIKYLYADRPEVIASWPKYWWPLDGTAVALGSDSTEWGGSVTYTWFAGKRWAVPTGTKAAMGVSLNLSADFVLQFDYFAPNGDVTAVEQIFTIASGTTPTILQFGPGTLNFYSDPLNGTAISTRYAMVDRRQHRITIYRTGNAIHFWSDDVYLGYINAAITGSALTHFMASNKHRFRNLKFWDTLPTDAAMLYWAGENFRKPALFNGLSNISGSGSTLIDANIADYAEGTALAAIGQIPNWTANMCMYGIQHLYHTFSGSDQNRKFLNIAVDELRDGNYVELATFKSTFNALSGTYPAREVETHENIADLELLNGNVRFRLSTPMNGYSIARCVQVRPLIADKPTTRYPSPVAGWYQSLSGHTAVLDGPQNVYADATNVYNAVGPAVVEAELPANYVGATLTKFEYRFSTATGLFGRKARWICIDQWDGTQWVEALKQETPPAALDDPENDYFVLRKPLTFTNTKMRIRAYNPHNDADGYVYVRDIRPFFKLAA